MTTLLITGANGFVGRHLTRAALERGWDVHAFSRDVAWLDAIEHDRLTVFQGDILHELDVNDHMFDVDSICHLAAFLPPDYSDPSYAEQCFQVNALATEKLLQIAKQREIERFIYYSSGNIYDQRVEVAREQAVVYPALYAPYYLSSKLTGEIFCEHYRQAHNMPVTILRLSSVYGAGMPQNNVVAIFLERAMNNQPIEVFDGGRRKADFVYVGDVVDATFAVLEHDANGIFNIGGGQWTSIRQLAETVTDVTDLDPTLLTIHPTEGEGGFSGFAMLDVSKAQEMWGYQPYSISQGLKDILEPVRKK